MPTGLIIVKMYSPVFYIEENSNCNPVKIQKQNQRTVTIRTENTSYYPSPSFFIEDAIRHNIAQMTPTYKDDIHKANICNCAKYALHFDWQWFLVGKLDWTWRVLMARLTSCKWGCMKLLNIIINQSWPSSPITHKKFTEVFPC